MTLTAMEFLRRFCMHVLPKGFVRIRHYGILSNANRNKKLLLVKGLIGSLQPFQTKRSTIEILEKLIGRNPAICRCCGGTLIGLNTLYRDTG